MQALCGAIVASTLGGYGSVFAKTVTEVLKNALIQTLLQPLGAIPDFFKARDHLVPSERGNYSGGHAGCDIQHST